MPHSLSADPPPELSLTQAHYLNLAFTTVYVLPLVFTKWTNPLLFSKDLLNANWRNDPTVIKARVFSVTVATLLSCSAMHYIINSQSDAALMTQLGATTLHLGGFFHRRDVLASFITPVLYIGPFYAEYLAGALPFQSNRSWTALIYDLVGDWLGIRNYLMGPFTEELVWRSCIIAAYRLAGASRNQVIFLSPLSFGVAHLHHGYESYVRLGRTGKAIKAACLSMIFQFAYTTLFGFHCAFLFYRTGSVFPPLTAHIFCNIMGLPQLAHSLKQFPRKTQQIKVFYAIGIVGYILTMRYWT